MTHRDRFVAVLEGRPIDRVPFHPDITDWYKARRTPRHQPQRFATGQFISDDDSFHRDNVDMPEPFRNFTLLEFYRRLDWGRPIHVYEAISTEHEGVKIRVERDAAFRHRYIETPVATLHTAWGMAPYGSESIVRYPVQGPDDLPVLEHWAAHSHYRGDPEAVQRVLGALGDRGVIDLPIGRTPFGLLVQELLGYERLACDYPDAINRMLGALAPGFWERVDVAAKLPGRIVIITDHADEHLINPRQFEQYCMLYYQEAQRRLHQAGKFVSTHLDGNIRSLLPLLATSGFDLLDGCTRAPMGNYEVEDLAKVLGSALKGCCGVPSALFCTRVPTEDIIAYGRRIIDALSPNVILNVGDVLPPDGDIDQVIALGEFAAG
jgi:hypothetical protein